MHVMYQYTKVLYNDSFTCSFTGSECTSSPVDKTSGECKSYCNLSLLWIVHTETVCHYPKAIALFTGVYFANISFHGLVEELDQW